MEQEKQKVCFKCGKQKPLSEFYRHKEMADGHLNKCKECTKKDTKENREKREDFYKAYDRQRSKLEHRKKYNKDRMNNPEVWAKVLQAKSDWAERNKEKRFAHHKVSNAIRDGHLHKQPCAVCGEIKDVEAHHEDYSKPP